MPKMFQIHEHDLIELERVMPEMADALTPVLTNRLRVQLRNCQSIVSKVRWRYGPHKVVDVIPGEDED